MTGAPFATIVVTDEVGAGIVPENAMARRFRDLLGWTNQAIAQTAERVLLMVAGYPLRSNNRHHQQHREFHQFARRTEKISRHAAKPSPVRRAQHGRKRRGHGISQQHAPREEGQRAIAASAPASARLRSPPGPTSSVPAPSARRYSIRHPPPPSPNAPGPARATAPACAALRPSSQALRSRARERKKSRPCRSCRSGCRA